MISRLQNGFAAFMFALAAVMAPPVVAQEHVDLTRLDTDNPEAFAFFDAIGLYDLLQIVAAESVIGADQIRQEFFPTVSPDVWETEMERLFAPDLLIGGFEAAWEDDALGPEARVVILEFYTSELGRRFVASEIAARQGMADPDVAEAARAAVALAERDNDGRLERHNAFSARLGLADRNLASMMNAQLQFMNGMMDGGGFASQLPEDDLLRMIAAQSGEMRAEAEEWLAAYQLMAYGAFSDAEFDRFVAVNSTAEGRALAGAIFSAFDASFDVVQYQLGRVAARFAAGDDI